MNLREEFVSERYIYKGHLVNLREDIVLSPGGNECKRTVVEHPGGACVVALTDDNNVIMVRQYRRPIDDILYEIPAGKLNEGEDPRVCIERELEEEAGCKAKEIQFLGFVYPTPGFCDEKIYMYYATGLERGQSNPDQDEYLEVSEEPLEQLVEKILSGQIKDAKTAIAVLKVYCMQQKS